MKIGLYQDPRGAIGGGEYCLAVLAHALLAEGHEVTLVHHQGERFAERLSDFFQIDLVGVDENPLPPLGLWCAPDSPLWRRRNTMGQWLREASEPYDAFVCITHCPPPFNYARVGILYVLFPLTDVFSPWGRPSAKESIRSWIYSRWWSERMQTYTSVASISDFTRRWTLKYWGVDSDVISPPVDVNRFTVGIKRDRIMVLGRFARAKNQLELVRTFRRYRERLPGWTMACIGGYSDSTSDARDYYASIEEQAAEGVADLMPNCGQELVGSELARSRIFWHAMGIGMDENLAPWQIEHFGIATVEAMAAGCVPIVVNGGGQREIVSNGETGFLCDSFDEFAERTIELSLDPVRTKKMADAAHDRSKDFARSVFVSKMMQRIRPHLASAQ